MSSLKRARSCTGVGTVVRHHPELRVLSYNGTRRPRPSAIVIQESSNSKDVLFDVHKKEEAKAARFVWVGLPPVRPLSTLRFEPLGRHGPPSATVLALGANGSWRNVGWHAARHHGQGASHPCFWMWPRRRGRDEAWVFHAANQHPDPEDEESVADIVGYARANAFRRLKVHRLPEAVPGPREARRP